jgi:quinol-cytochrome oxidoreductase complex cytochrome b subunit
VVAAAALVGLALTSLLLTWRYRPSSGVETYLLPASLRWSRRLVRRHQLAALIALPSLALWAALTVRHLAERSRARVTVIASAIAAMALVAVTELAWRRIRWDQLGLWAVTVGDEFAGTWVAGSAGRVRFAVVAGHEVSPGSIRFWTIVHLAAPVLALAALAACWLVARPPRPPRRSIVEPDPAPRT